MDKKSERIRLLNLLKNFSDSEIQEKSKIICNKILNFDAFKKASKIAVYHPIKKFSEINIGYLVDQSKEKIFCWPKIINADEMQFYTKDDKLVDCVEIDLFIIPLVGFNEQKYRIGHGKGYYDKYLQNCSQPKIGVGLECLKTFFIFDNWDIALDNIFTETSIY